MKYCWFCNLSQPQKINKMALLTIQNGMLTLGGKPLFNNVQIAIENGEKACLVGRNGTGKSTLLKIIAEIFDK